MRLSVVTVIGNFPTIWQNELKRNQQQPFALLKNRKGKKQQYFVNVKSSRLYVYSVDIKFDQ